MRSGPVNQHKVQKLYEPFDLSINAIRGFGSLNAQAQFVNNLLRIQSTIILPATFFIFGQRGPSDSNKDVEFLKSLASLWQKGSPQRSDILQAVSAADDVFDILHFDYLQHWLYTIITTTWTAFETLSGDLWIEVIDKYPKYFWELGSSEKLKISDLADITEMNFNATGKVGELLATTCSFNSLRGIREAYTKLFYDDNKNACKTAIQEIMNYLTSKELDLLSALRNNIVHKSGIPDIEYEKRTKHIQDKPIEYPDFKGNARIMLDGVIVRSLIDNAIKCGFGLCDVVAKWVIGKTIRIKGTI